MPGVSFDQAAEYYDATRGYQPGTAEQIRDAIVSHLALTRASRVLEMGVGTGRIALPFILAGYDYTGVDLSQPMMNRLVEKVESSRQTELRYRLQQADVTELPFSEASFDLVIMVHILHLVSNWQLALDEARRVLARSNGHLLVGYDVPKDPDQPSPVSQVRERWTAILTELGQTNHQERAGVWGSDGRIGDYLEQSGATVEDVMLVEYQWPPLSARQMAERHKNRLYSSDWKTPDDIQQEASRRLDQWLEQDYPEPDRLVSHAGQFHGLIARWP